MTTYEAMATRAMAEAKATLSMAGAKKPWRWQARLAEAPLPELLNVPTGCGKTAGVVLAWLYRRRFHPDASVRSATPRRLVFVLPMRTLVEQTRDAVCTWLENLDLDGDGGVRLTVLMGGEPTTDDWRVNCTDDTVIVGTLDMILSRALNRGFGESRYSWPIDFGLLNTDCAYVLDEVQLMGAARPTSRQLQSFRAQWGTAAPVTSTWMSATLDADLLRTVDAPDTTEPFTLDGDEVTQTLRDRLDAERTVERWIGETDKARAAAVVDQHRAGTLTIAVLNTIDAARKLHAEIARLKPSADLCLLHSRFRPADRAALMREVRSQLPPAGRIVCSTQVIEAGVDLSAATLFTEVAPWSSVVQRVGRCNRDGLTKDARVFWYDEPSPGPYPEADLDAARDQLARLTGTTITTRSITDLTVAESGGEESQVLRRADLLRLFDTAADVGGNDLDISPFLRDGQDLDARLCWRSELTAGLDQQPPPGRGELCAVSLGELAKWRRGKALYRLDHLAREQNRWVRLPPDERVMPGQIVLADSRAGGYSANTGWTPASKTVVEAMPADVHDRTDPAPLDERIIDEPATTAGRWVTLTEHLDDVDREVRAMLRDLSYNLPETLSRSAIVAGRWHDWGKAHPVFQARLHRTSDGRGDAEAAECPDEAALWAKSAAGRGGAGGPDDRRYYRHELASALALAAAPEQVIGSGADRDLAAYLVAAHHGRIRMSIRSAPDEEPAPNGGRYAMGVWEGDELPGVTAGGVDAPRTTLELVSMDIAGSSRSPSWVHRAAALLGRDDLGPFRLAFLEALVRLADWRASARYRQETGAGR